MIGWPAAPSQGRVGWDQSFLHAFFLLHSPVLKPDLHLCLVELQCTRDFNPAGSSQVLVEVELLLQLCQLLGREVGAARVVDAAGTGLTSVASVGFRLRNCKVEKKILSLRKNYNF